MKYRIFGDNETVSYFFHTERERDHEMAKHARTTRIVTDPPTKIDPPTR